MSKVKERKRVQVFFNEPSRTKQAFKDMCDINKIMARFKKVQGADFLQRYNGCVGGQFGDFSNVTDYRSAIDQVRLAEDRFMSMPAVVRKRFQNDPAQFLDFCSDPSNIDELVSMGLASKPVVSETLVEKKEGS